MEHDYRKALEWLEPFQSDSPSQQKKIDATRHALLLAEKVTGCGSEEMESAGGDAIHTHLGNEAEGWPFRCEACAAFKAMINQAIKEIEGEG